jgi:hypothetical protein
MISKYIKHFKSLLIDNFDKEVNKMKVNNKNQNEILDYFQSIRGSEYKKFGSVKNNNLSVIRGGYDEFMKYKTLFWRYYNEEESENLLGINEEYILDKFEIFQFKKFVKKEKGRSKVDDVKFGLLFNELKCGRVMVVNVDDNFNYNIVKIKKYRDENNKLKYEVYFENYLFFMKLMNEFIDKKSRNNIKNISSKKILSFFDNRDKMLDGIFKKYDVLSKWYCKKLGYDNLKENDYDKFLDRILREIFVLKEIDIDEYKIVSDYGVIMSMKYSKYINENDYMNLMVKRNKNYKSDEELIKYYRKNN